MNQIIQIYLIDFKIKYILETTNIVTNRLSRRGREYSLNITKYNKEDINKQIT